jgi:hypothetical protein
LSKKRLRKSRYAKNPMHTGKARRPPASEGIVDDFEIEERWMVSVDGICAWLDHEVVDPQRYKTLNSQNVDDFVGEVRAR